VRVVVASKLTDVEKALIEELWSLGLPERATAGRWAGLTRPCGAT
jgi:hypothetical protein